MSTLQITSYFSRISIILSRNDFQRFCIEQKNQTVKKKFTLILSQQVTLISSYLLILTVFRVLGPRQYLFYRELCIHVTSLLQGWICYQDEFCFFIDGLQKPTNKLLIHTISAVALSTTLIIISYNKRWTKKKVSCLWMAQAAFKKQKLLTRSYFFMIQFFSRRRIR